jgi:hypothetical protein
MLEYLLPSYSLDLLTAVVIATGNVHDCSLMACKRVSTIDLFKLLK